MVIGKLNQIRLKHLSPRIFGLIGILCSFAGEAQAWEKIFECRAGEVVVDRYLPTGGLVFYQVVIRNESVVERLRSQNVVFFYRVNELNELILPLSRSLPSDHGSVLFIGDYDALRDDGRLYELTLYQDRLTFEAFQTTYSGAGPYKKESELSEYVFHHCQAVLPADEQQKSVAAELDLF